MQFVLEVGFHVREHGFPITPIIPHKIAAWQIEDREEGEEQPDSRLCPTLLEPSEGFEKLELGDVHIAEFAGSFLRRGSEGCEMIAQATDMSKIVQLLIHNTALTGP